MSKKICRDFLKGSCRYGDNCKFVHDKEYCKYHFVHGNCRHGDNCKFKHAGDDICQPVPAGSRPPRRGKNTESFEPSDKPADMRIIVNEHSGFQGRDVVVVTDLWGRSDPPSFEALKQEIDAVKDKVGPELFKLWHGDTHLIADDKLGWKKSCPLFQEVVDCISKYFNMDIKATRFNLYTDEQWKPFHHDAAAVKPDKALTQNFTVGVSFGATRDIAFEHAKTRTTVSIPQPHGSTYAFGKDVNIEWRHGVPQNLESKGGRISIIAWGWVDGIN